MDGNILQVLLHPQFGILPSSLGLPFIHPSRHMQEVIGIDPVAPANLQKFPEFLSEEPRLPGHAPPSRLDASYPRCVGVQLKALDKRISAPTIREQEREVVCERKFAGRDG